MSAAIMMMLGAGVGAGVLLVLVALRPIGQPISEVFEAVERPARSFNSEDAATRVSPRDSLIRLGIAAMFGLGDESNLRKDLAVTGSSVEQHALVKAGLPALSLVAVYLLWVLSVLVGRNPGPLFATVAAIASALVAFVAPDVRLRSAAKAARVAFRHALSAYLDLVTVIISGGGGLLTALQASADLGDGWAFAEIRASLDRARLSNRTPWSQLGVLAERFDIVELQDLVSAAELAGSEGARISESVATKADVLRARLQSEVEQTSESLTEQMLIPVGLIMVALFLFLGFGVFSHLSSNSGTQQI